MISSASTDISELSQPVAPPPRQGKPWGDPSRSRDNFAQLARETALVRRGRKVSSRATPAAPIPSPAPVPAHATPGRRVPPVAVRSGRSAPRRWTLRFTGRQLGAVAACVALGVFALSVYRSCTEADGVAQAAQGKARLAEAAQIRGQIGRLSDQAQALELRAQIDSRYGEDLRHHSHLWAADASDSQAGAHESDRERVLREMGKLNFKLYQLVKEGRELEAP